MCSICFANSAAASLLILVPLRGGKRTERDAPSNMNFTSSTVLDQAYLPLRRDRAGGFWLPGSNRCALYSYTHRRKTHLINHQSHTKACDWRESHITALPQRLWLERGHSLKYVRNNSSHADGPLALSVSCNSSGRL